MDYFAKAFGQIFFVSLLVLFPTSSLLAGHIIGAEIGWKCVGKDSFKMELTMYQDCNSISPNSATIKISSNCGTTDLNLSIISTEDITPVCADQCNACDSRGCTFGYGIQRVQASAILNVSTYRSSSCCELTAAFSDCCRRGISTDLFYVSSKMNICQSPCDNSPVFKNDPFTVLCLGQDVIRSQQATDVDGDSLVYSLVQASISATNYISFPSSYAYDKPLYFLGFPNATASFPRGFHLNSENGQMMFRPMKEEESVIALEVASYRNGKRIGLVKRDVRVMVIKCPSNAPPIISGLNCKLPRDENFELEVCPGEEICFTICTSDNDKDDTVGLTWSGCIPGASFTIANKTSKRQSATFCWTPEEKDVRTEPYRFTAMAFDDACPVNGRMSRTFSITVKAPAPQASLSKSVGTCGKMELRAQQVDRPDIANYAWLLEEQSIQRAGKKADTLDYTTTSSDNFKYQLEVTGTNGCTRTYTDSLLVPKHVSLITNDSTLCAGDSFELRAKAVYPQGNYSISWGTSDTTYNQKSRLKGLLEMEDSTITVTINDEVCEYSRDILVQANTPPLFSLGKHKRLCMGRDIRLGARLYKDSTDRDSIFQYRWYLSTDTSTLSRDTMLLVSESHTYLLEVIDSMGCTIKDSVRTYMDAGWVPKDMSICAGDSLFIQLPTAKPRPTYLWNDNPRDTSAVSFIGENRKVQNQSDGYYFIRRVYPYQGASCTTYDSFKVMVHALPATSVQPKTASICPNEKLLLRGNPSLGQWTGPSVNETATEIRLLLRGNPAGVYKYVYQYIDSNQCSNTDTSVVTLRSMPKASYRASDSIISIAEGIDFINTSTNAQNSLATWLFQSNVSIFDRIGDSVHVRFYTPGVHTMKLLVTDTLSACSDTLYRKNMIAVLMGLDEKKQNAVHIYPNPATHTVWIALSEDNLEGHFMLFDATGRQVSTQYINQASTSVSIESLPQGIYHWNLITESGTAVGKLVVQKPY